MVALQLVEFPALGDGDNELMIRPSLILFLSSPHAAFIQVKWLLHCAYDENDGDPKYNWAQYSVTSDMKMGPD